ncbi:MAG: DUF2062 domain-containing protein [Hyphomicrobiales bacterium]|nr:DUF2062 domain-containing protein [Hyphomicrobiales bacterium]
MLFRRRERPTVLERLRVALWPRRSWARSLRYFGLRLSRIGGSAHSVAAGFAAGVFAIVTPFLGFQMILAAVLALAVRGSVIASAIGSFVGNPLTYPLIWISTYQLGALILGESGAVGRIDFQGKAEAVWNGLKALSPEAVGQALEAFWPILKPMAVGSMPIGLAAALISYAMVLRAVESIRTNRAERLNLKAI